MCIRDRSRYSYEIWLIRIQSESQSRILGNDLISRTLQSVSWESALRDEAVKFNKFASETSSKYVSPHSALSGHKHHAFNKELSIFLSETEKS